MPFEGKFLAHGLFGGDFWGDQESVFFSKS